MKPYKHHKRNKRICKTLYLASPYNHKNKAIRTLREKQITMIAAKLTAKYGHCMFLPITQSAAMARCHEFGTGFDEWAQIDLTAIEAMQEFWVVKLDGWDKSIGVRYETQYATKLKKTIRYIDPITLRFVRPPKKNWYL